MTWVPLASLARNSSTFETVRLKATTVNPWSFMLRIRFWPMTARPIRAISALASMRSIPVQCSCGGFNTSEHDDTTAQGSSEKNLGAQLEARISVQHGFEVWPVDFVHIVEGVEIHRHGFRWVFG